MNILRAFKNQDSFNNSKYTIINSFLSFIFKLITSILIVRYIGVINNGIYSYIYATSAIFSCLAEFSMESIILREGVGKMIDHKVVLGTAVVLRTFTGIIAAALFIFYICYCGLGIQYIICSLCVSASYIGHLFYIFRAYIISQNSAKDFFHTQNVCLFIFFILKILFVYFKIDFIFIFIINAFEYCVSGILYYLVYAKKYGYRLGFSLDVFLMFIKDGFLLTLSGLAIVFYIKCDQIMLRNMMGESALGIYAVAVMLAEFWYFIPTTINSSLSPKIYSVLDSGDDERIDHCFELYYRFMFVLSMGMGIIISLLSKPLIIFVYGEEYSSSVSVLRLYIWAGLFVCFGVVRSNYLIYYKYNIFNAVIAVSACIINIILNYHLIPVLYECGAAVSTVITYFFSAMFSSLLWSKTRKNGFIQIKALLCPFTGDFL